MSHRYKTKAFCKLGTRIKLKKRLNEPAEFGVYMGVSGNECHMVRLDLRHRVNRSDDGLREVGTDLLEHAT